MLQALDRWEERLEALFEGRPYDELDATLTDTLTQFPVDIQPFRCVCSAEGAPSAGLALAAMQLARSSCTAKSGVCSGWTGTCGCTSACACTGFWAVTFLHPAGALQFDTRRQVPAPNLANLPYCLFWLCVLCCRDMVDGMRMDLVKSRYDNYDELYEYCYRVAGTVALMSMPVMGVDPAYKVGGCAGRAVLESGWLPPVGT